MQRSIIYGSRKIVYQLQRKHRKTMAIQVHPDQTVWVIAPEDASEKLIESRLRLKAKWIINKQLYFASFHPRSAERRFVGGESHLYMGRQYKLKLIKAKENTVMVFQGAMRIKTTSTTREELALLVENWYREKAAVVFNSVLENVFTRFARYKIPQPTIVIRKMSTRWGSCTARGKIILNPDLIKAPTSCIEYVIVHELVHLVYRNHTKAFYKLLKKVLPDWEKRKEKLEYLLA